MKNTFRRTADTAPDEPLPIPPHPRLLHGGTEVDALPDRIRQAGEQAQLPPERPENDDRLHAFFA